MSLAMRPNEVNTEVQYDCKVRHQAVIFLYTEVLNMRKNLTEIVFILDRSGSMSGLETDTIGGFNSMIEKQKKENGEALIAYSVAMVQQDRASWCMATAKMVHAFRADGALSFHCHYVGVCFVYCTATAAIARSLCRGNYSVIAFNRRMDSPLMVST